MHALAAALVLAACAAKKASKVKATKPPNEYSTKNTTIAASPWRRKGRGGRCAATFDSTQVWAFSSQTRNWTRLVADADDPEVELDNVFSDGVQLAIALLVALVVTGAALRARFRHDDAYDGPPGVQASPYVGVA